MVILTYGILMECSSVIRDFAMNAEKRLTLVELKQMISAIDGSHPVERRSFSLFSEGFPKGRIVELTGMGKTTFLTEFIKEYPSLKVMWIEKDLTINPFALWQQGVDLRQITFIETKELIWATQQVLQSQLFEVIVFSHPDVDEKNLRRFQVMVEKTEGHLFLLADDSYNSWIPALQIEVHKTQQDTLQAQVTRKRGIS